MACNIAVKALSAAGPPAVISAASSPLGANGHAAAAMSSLCPSNPRPKPPFGIDDKSYDGMPDPRAIEKLNRLIESSGPTGTGPFEVHVARSFPLDQAAEAHRTLGEHYLGKLVLQTG